MYQVGNEIYFVKKIGLFKWRLKSARGRMMPCENRLRLYWANDNGPYTVITHYGDVVRCRIEGDIEHPTGYGRVVHWQLCAHPEKMKKEPKKRAKKPAAVSAK